MTEAAQAAPTAVHTLNRTRTVDGLVWVAGAGPAPAHTMIIAPCPGRDELATGRPMVGPAANSLRKLLGKVGFNLQFFYWTYLVKYSPSGGKNNDFTADDINRCREILEAEIARVQPKFIITLGAEPLKYLAGRNFSTSDFQACLLQPPGRDFKVYVLEDPWMLVREPEYLDDFRQDLVQFREIILDNPGLKEMPPANYSVISTMAQLEGWMASQIAEGVTVYSVDCEWGRGNFKYGLLRSMQLCWKPRHAVFIRFLAPGGAWAFDAPKEVVFARLREFLNRPLIRYIGHNVGEDFLWMEQQIGIDVRERAIFDTMYAAHLCNEYEPVGLERLSVRYTPFGRYDLALMQELRDKKINVEEDGYIPLSDEVIIPYGCLDVDVPMICWPILTDRLRHEGVLDFYTSEVLPTVTEVGRELRRNGLPVDLDRINDLTVIYNKKQDEMILALRKNIHADAFQRVLAALGRLAYAPEIIQMLFQADMGLLPMEDFVAKVRHVSNILAWNELEAGLMHYSESKEFNINSKEHKARLLFDVLKLEPIKTTGKRSMSWSRVKLLEPEKQAEYSPSVDNQTLEILRDDHELVEEMWKVMRVNNITKMFLRRDRQGLQRHVSHADNRLYYDGTFLTETGRLRTTPNVQNWPKRADATLVEIFGKKDMPPSIRTCVIAPPGYVLMESDYESAELFVLAYLSGDKNMIGALTSPDDNYVQINQEGKKSFVRRQTITTEQSSNIVVRADGSFIHPKRDLHWEMAEEVAKKYREVLDAEKDRVAAKSGNFGIPYGMHAPTLARKIRADTGMPYSEEEAAAFIEGHERRFETVHAYLQRQEQIVWSELSGGVNVNAYGRKRRFYLGSDFYDKSERQQSRLKGALGRESRNFPIQSYVADSINRASVLFLRSRNQMGLRTQLILILHDAMLLCVYEPELEIVRKLVETYMCDATVHQTPGGLFRLGVDTKIYHRWTEKTKK